MTVVKIVTLPEVGRFEFLKEVGDIILRLVLMERNKEGRRGEGSDNSGIVKVFTS